MQEIDAELAEKIRIARSTQVVAEWLETGVLEAGDGIHNIPFGPKESLDLAMAVRWIYLTRAFEVGIVGGMIINITVFSYS